MARERIPDADAIAERLSQWVHAHYGSFTELCKRKGFHRSNADKWAGGQVPGAYFLWKLAREDGLDVFWLLTAKRTPGERPIQDRLREHLLAYFTSALKWPRPRVERYLPDPDHLWRYVRASVRNAIGRADWLRERYGQVRRPARERERVEREAVKDAWDQAMGAWRPTAPLPADVRFVPPRPAHRAPQRTPGRKPVRRRKA